MQKIKLLLTLLLGVVYVCSTSAQVVINEFSAANYDLFDFDPNPPTGGGFGGGDEDNELHSDWIELYNTSGSSVDLSGYHLSDRTANPMKWTFPAGTTIPANGHLLVLASGLDDNSFGYIHTNFKITQTQPIEAVVFSDPSGTIIDFHNIDESNQVNDSWGRTTDGGSTWSLFLNPTIGTSNTNPKINYAERPTISPTAGFYAGPVQISLSTIDPNLTIYYTTDGSEPDNGSALYTGPFMLPNTSSVKAIAYSNDPDYPPSFIDYSTFFINENHNMKVVSISGEGLNPLLGGDNSLEPWGYIEVFDETGDRVADATGEYNKHGNDSWAYDQRGIDYITRDQFGDDYAIKNDLFDMFDVTTRDRYQRIILKAAANDNYPFENGAHVRDGYVHVLSQLAGLDMDERSYEPCVLYKNGEYWGIYEFREKVDDDDYIEYYYNHEEEYIQYIKTWGGTWAEYGGNQALTDWNTLYNFIINNDMSDPINYANVENQFNLLSLIDYMILNTHVVSKDWLSWNTAWWRATDPLGDPHVRKWRYTLWDLDATFGHYINYTGVPDDSPTSDPCNNESPDIDDPEGHTQMLTSLLENEDFFALYINRYADLNNTYFTCEFMEGLLDSMINRIQPEMTRHIGRWGGSMNGWEDAVQDLRDFINTRCTVIDNGIEGCYEVEGPYPLVVIVDPPLSGDVQVNTLVPLNYPYEADYFSGISVDLTALPSGINAFDYWEPVNSTLNPNLTDTNVDFELLGPDTIIAHFIVNTCAINVTPSTVDATCSASDGIASLVPTGANPPFSFQWDGSAGNQIAQTATGLAAGAYNVTVTDNLGCADVITVNITASNGTLNSSATNIPSNCSNNDGSASITVTGGTAPFSYQWDAATGNQTTATAINLAPGVYTATISDANGCVNNISTTVGNGGGLSFTSNATNALCTSSTGTASVTVTTGTPPYTYQWDAAAGNQTTATANNLPTGDYFVTVTDGVACAQVQMVTVGLDTDNLNLQTSSTDSNCGSFDGTATVSALGGTAPYSYLWDAVTGSQTTQTAINLGVGNYMVVVTDANGCQTAIDVPVTASGSINIALSSTDANCGQANGTATASVLTGTAPYSYLWDAAAGNQTTQVANGLDVGTYSATITDAVGCTAVESVTVGDAGSVVVNIQATESNCSVSGSSASAVVINGTAPYTYLWNTGETLPSIGGLSTGTYTVTVTDANGCSEVQSALVNSVNNGPTLSTTQTNISCTGATDGTIDLNVTGGTAPFTYDWGSGITTEDVDNLPAGSYTVIVSDAGGCVAVVTAVISEPTVLTVGTTSTPSDGTDGTASAIPNGGVPPYSYEWSDGQMTQVANGLAPGTYTVEVTDANGCSIMGTVQVGMFTGVSDLASLDQFRLYPNPSNGLFNIDLMFNTFESFELSVINPLGQEIRKWNLEGTTFTLPVDIQAAAAGMYFIRLKTKDGEVSRQVLKID